MRKERVHAGLFDGAVVPQFDLAGLLVDGKVVLHGDGTAGTVAKSKDKIIAEVECAEECQDANDSDDGDSPHASTL